MAGPVYIVRDRLAFTRDGRVVPYEHTDAAFLAYVPGQVISLAEAQAAALPGAKAAAPVEDKMVVAPAEDKTAVVTGKVQVPPESKRQPGRPAAANVRKGGK